MEVARRLQNMALTGSERGANTIEQENDIVTRMRDKIGIGSKLRKY